MNEQLTNMPVLITAQSVVTPTKNPKWFRATPLSEHQIGPVMLASSLGVTAGAVVTITVLVDPSD